jgi:hypothetical protein
VWAGLYQHGGAHLPVALLVGIMYATASLLVLLRAGLLGFIAFNLGEQVLVYLPVSTDFSAWYAGVSTLSLLFVGGLAACASWTACKRERDRRGLATEGGT